MPQARRFTELGTISSEPLPELAPVDRLTRSVNLHPDDTKNANEEMKRTGVVVMQSGGILKTQ